MRQQQYALQRQIAKMYLLLVVYGLSYTNES